MQVTHLTAERREKWNALVAQEPSFGLLQSWEWGDFKETLGWKPYRIGVEQQGRLVAGAQILIKTFPLNLFSVAYVPRGPVGNWLSDGTTAKLLSGLHQISRQHKAVFLKIEPALLFEPAICQTLQSHHFRASPYTNQPRVTLIVDLRQDLEEILRQMGKKTRQYIRHAAREGVSVRRGGLEDFPAFYNMIELTSRHHGFSARVRDYYERLWQVFSKNDQVVLFMAYHEGKLLAVRTAYYFVAHAAEIHAGSLTAYNNFRANHLLVWEGIKWAKAQGCHTYDLWGGIPDEVGQAFYEGEDLPGADCTDDLWGVYRFKHGFSKNLLFYVNSHDYVYSPLLYKLVMNKFLTGGTFDRIATWMDFIKGIRRIQ